MNQIFASAAALTLAAMLWAFGKKSLKVSFLGLGKDLKTNLTGSNTTLVLEKKTSQNAKSNTSNSMELDWIPPQNIREKTNLKKQLNQLILGGPEDRMKAIRICSVWDDKSVLPILKQGLKDFNSEIIIESAAALEKYKGVTTNTEVQDKEIDRPPLNVALMR